MNVAEGQEPLRLRPHHLLCDRFLPLELVVRNEEFARAVQEIEELTRPERDTVVVLVEGPDRLCPHCPDLKDGRCESPAGDEEKVRRWDARILEGLGVSYGTAMVVREWLALIEERAPFAFCETRCPWRTVCRVFDA
ncbi:MAG: DUF1284 domain-containing protein [Actinobacteria bacterium]|nr:DUF1284 domain-containing protein [Actinomycetota bacterium]